MLSGPDWTFDGIGSVTFTATDSNGNDSLNSSEFNIAQLVTVSIGASCSNTGTGL